MASSPSPIGIPDFILKYVDLGVLVVNRQMQIIFWNNFMEHNSGRSASEVAGKNLFSCFSGLPESWLKKKVNSVFVLKNVSFSAWEQRPYLFRFPHNRPITGSIDYMYQNLTFIPIKNHGDGVDYVCITLADVTDTAISQIALKKALAALEESNNRDGLTGLYNRRYLEERLGMEFSRAKRYGEALSFLLLDIDHFKSINDTYGHLAGDEVLSTVSRRVNNLLRASDTMGRYGGEEFGIICCNTGLDRARGVAERICRHIADIPVKYKAASIAVTASIGINQFHADMPGYEPLILGADAALYKAKKDGRNRVICLNPDVV